MTMKWVAVLVLGIVFLWQLCLSLVEYVSTKNPMPENVRDIYNEGEFTRWQAYEKEHIRCRIVGLCVGVATEIAVVIGNVFSWIEGVILPGIHAGANGVGDDIVGALVVFGFYLLFSSLVNLPFEFYSTMKIEQKYGFNKTTVGTFFADEAKSFLVSALLFGVLISLFVLLHHALGDAIIWVFAAILMAVVLGVAFLAPLFSRIYNKFSPLEEGELKSALTALLEKHGYTVKAIEVMDASRRTTKSNAYFTGFGKNKHIVLYDTLLSSMTTEEICAIFAHEMGHGLHKDTLKFSFLSFAQMAFIAVAGWLLVRDGALYGSFGFSGVQYGMAFFLLFEVVMATVSPLIGLVQNAVSRHAEYRADEQAVTEGYGEALISGLKKLSKENFSHLAPSPLLVALEYSHPTLSQRITHIENEK